MSWRPRPAAALAACAVLLAACTSALRQPRSVQAMAPPPSGREVLELLREAEAAWARRAEPGQAAAAQDLYLEAAAAADRSSAPAILGAMRAMTFRVEHEPAGEARARLAEEQVELGQRCQQVAPTEPACDYRLAIALGQQARERPATGVDALKRMHELLQKAIAAAPRMDEAGPHRVLALLLLRAPGWPLGPGDPQGALAEAREAARLHPEAATNQLALGEALEKNGDLRAARAAYERALERAEAAALDDPDAPGWGRDARAGLSRVDGG